VADLGPQLCFSLHLLVHRLLDQQQVALFGQLELAPPALPPLEWRIESFAPAQLTTLLSRVGRRGMKRGAANTARESEAINPTGGAIRHDIAVSFSSASLQTTVGQHNSSLRRRFKFETSRDMLVCAQHAPRNLSECQPHCPIVATRTRSLLWSDLPFR
jgi:hypothetical protein